MVRRFHLRLTKRTIVTTIILFFLLTISMFAVDAAKRKMIGGGSGGGSGGDTDVEIDLDKIIREPFKFLPLQKINKTGILLDIGSILYTGVVNRSRGNFPANDEDYLTPKEFMGAYSDLQRSYVTNKGLLPSIDNLSEISQNMTESKGVYPILLAIINYTVIKETSFDDDLFNFSYSNGTLIQPGTNLSTLDDPINYLVETPNGRNTSYVDYKTFVGANVLRDIVYDDGQQMFTFEIPSNFLVMNNVGSLDNLSISFPGIPNNNITDGAFVPINLDTIYVWNVSGANFVQRPNGTNVDSDNDSLVDISDNCPNALNPDQEDNNGNGVGDACDFGDIDGDQVSNNIDNCPDVYNPTQTPGPGASGRGDACIGSGDIDGDGMQDRLDNCVLTANPSQTDRDNDGVGDACDGDCSNAAVTHICSNQGTSCTSDTDCLAGGICQTAVSNTGICSTVNEDFDFDGITNRLDNCPTVANPSIVPVGVRQKDSNRNGVGDSCDLANNVADIKFVVKVGHDNNKFDFAPGDVGYVETNPIRFPIDGLQPYFPPYIPHINDTACGIPYYLAFYPGSRPSFWPSDWWENKSTEPLTFFNGQRPSFWPNNYPWPVPYRMYLIDTTPTASILSWMGIQKRTTDPVVYGPLYNSQNGNVGEARTTANKKHNYADGLNTRMLPAFDRNDLDRCKAKNLVVLVDGLDITQSRTINTILGDFKDPITKMRQKGYDVLVLDYIDGRDYIQRNGYALASVLQAIPSYMAPGYENQKAIVLAGSMGTQVSRFALAKSEENGADHHTGLWIASDGPFVGANVPWAVQATIRFFAAATGDQSAISQVQGLDSPGAKQMLRKHTTFAPNSNYSKYYNEVNALNGGTGLPQKLRKVAIVSGSGSGLYRLGSQAGDDPSSTTKYNIAYSSEVTYDPLNKFYYGISVNANTERNAGSQGESTFTGYLREPYKWINKKIPYGYTKNYNYWVWKVNSGASDGDISPGGYKTFGSDIVNGYNDMVRSSDKLNIEMTSELLHSGFIPTFSSLYYRGAESGTMDYSASIYKRYGGYSKGIFDQKKPNVFSKTYTGKLPVTDIWYGPEDTGKYFAHIDPDIQQKSPFDAVWYEIGNTEHVITSGQPATVGSEAFLFNEMDMFSSQEEFSNRALNEPKRQSNEIFFAGNITGCGTDETLAINTFTKEAMVQRFEDYASGNGYWNKIWEGNDSLGQWNIDKGDKFYLVNAMPDKANSEVEPVIYSGKLELVAFRVSTPGRYAIMKLSRNQQSCAGATFYWQALQYNYGNGWIGNWKIRPTDIYAFGNVTPTSPGMGEDLDEILAVSPYTGNNEIERIVPGKGGRSNVSLLENTNTGFNEVWNNRNDLDFINHWAVRFGDHIQFARTDPFSVFSNPGVESLFTTNMIRNLFSGGDRIYLYRFANGTFYHPPGRIVSAADLQYYNPVANNWVSYWNIADHMAPMTPKIGEWTIGGLEDSYDFIDVFGGSLNMDSLIITNNITVQIYIFDITANWDLINSTSKKLANTYDLQSGDRFYFGKFSGTDVDNMLVLNPDTRSHAAIFYYDVINNRWVKIWQDDGSNELGYWRMYQR